MKLVSKTALGLALAVGSVSMMAAPAMAQKKPKEEAAKAPNFKLSKEFRAAMAPVAAAHKAQDWPTMLTAADGIEAAATTPDEKYVLNQYRLEAAGKANNEAQQAKALDGMLATGLVPAADQGKFHFFAGRFALNAKNYAKAEAEFARAAQLNFQSTDLYLQQARLYSGQNKFAQAAASVDQAIKIEEATGKKAPEDWYKFGLGQAYKAKNDAEVGRWSMAHMKAYPSAENWRTTLVLYRDTQKLGSKVELDLYRLMRASKALAGEKDFYDYAYIAHQSGLPGEAKAAIEQMRASGTPSSAAGVTELYKEASARAAGDKASLANEEKNLKSGTQAAGVASAYLGYGDYAKAATLFQTALTKGGVDADEVNTRLGIALALQGQKEQAKAAFAKVTTPARAGVAKLWVTWLDNPVA